MAREFQIKAFVKTPRGRALLDKVSCRENQSILEAFEERGLSLTFSCRAGACGSCAVRLIKGRVDDSLQSFYAESASDRPFILSCISKPLENCEIEIHETLS